MEEDFAETRIGHGFPDENEYVLHEEAEDYLHRYLRQVPYINNRALRIYREGADKACNRRIARAESEDFINWTEPQGIIMPDELDPPKLYSMSNVDTNGFRIPLQWRRESKLEQRRGEIVRIRLFLEGICQEDSGEKPRPCHRGRAGWNRMGAGLGVFRWRLTHTGLRVARWLVAGAGHDERTVGGMRRQDAMVTDQVQARRWRQPLGSSMS